MTVKKLAFIFFMLPVITWAQEGGETFRDVEPPPTPINESIVVLWIAALMVGFYFIYSRNQKFKTNDKILQKRQ